MRFISSIMNLELSTLTGVVYLSALLNPIAAEVDFNRDIRPVLSDNCWACHGPDESKRKAGLRLDVRESALSALKSGRHALVPGDPSRSLVMERIRSSDPADLMPPPESGKKLTAQQVDLIERWIREGAEFKNHWAFITPQRPSLPEVKLQGWVRNEIDAFILARLEQQGLKPSPEADRETLIRRVTLDLTGLPPSIKEVEDFLADSGPDAYERLVNRLLESQHFGERMAEHWLDLARYADTHGYHLDSGRDMWKWRDWVIEAFNDNKPYDQFTVEQLAGDLLPGATRDQVLATGFNRNSMINFEGGAIPQEYLTQYIKDRVVTTSTVYLGLTMGCAECHDHKFDPLSMKDFYQFYAYFNAVPENGLDGSRGNAQPVIHLPTPEQEKALSRLESLKKNKDVELKNALADIDLEQRSWEEELKGRSSGSGWEILQTDELHSDNGSILQKQDDGSVLVSGPNPDTETYTIAARLKGKDWLALRIEALMDESLPGKGPGRYENASFVLDEATVQIRGVEDASNFLPVEFSSARADYHQTGFEESALIDGNPKTGWAIDAPLRKRNGEVTLISRSPFGMDGEFIIEIKLDFGGSYKQHGLGRFRLSVTSSAISLLPPDIQTILSLAEDQRSESEKQKMADYYRARYSETYKRIQGEMLALEKEMTELRDGFVTSMVMEQMDQPRDSFILMRGQYDQPGEKVSPAPPDRLYPVKEDAPPNRLGLAQWLVDPDHPLVSRVTVNRFWQMLMGTGIVKTSNDFGSQGEFPSHPRLLDWLAREFVESGWDVKHLLKEIVCSSTYRQSTQVKKELLERDPGNRLLARGPRFRLSAEQIRDNALAISGLLVRKIGGPSVSPYQPPGLWQELSSRKDSTKWTAQIFVQDHGEDLYRRSIYTFWKRTCPPPSLVAFDAPDRETCTVYRERTSTPLQALVLMNDPTYVEASRVLAEEMILQGGSSAEEKIAYAFRKATARHPMPQEIELLKKLYEEQWLRFGNQPEEAEKIMQAGEYPRNGELDVRVVAAWAMVASTILNLDETINKG